jgi:UDP:flavonoid glycosyltransferase YjiC (YdhE family)
MGRDQNDVAARVVYRGAGLRLGVGASPTQIRTAVTRVLYEPTFRESANRLASVIRRDAAASKAVDELVAIASG